MKSSSNIYGQAKETYTNLPLMNDVVLSIDSTKDIALFRKHLSEMIKRQGYNKKFVSAILNKGQLLIKRIK